MADLSGLPTWAEEIDERISSGEISRQKVLDVAALDDNKYAMALLALLLLEIRDELREIRARIG